MIMGVCEDDGKEKKAYIKHSSSLGLLLFAPLRERFLDML